MLNIRKNAWFNEQTFKNYRLKLPWKTSQKKNGIWAGFGRLSSVWKSEEGKRFHAGGPLEQRPETTKQACEIWNGKLVLRDTRRWIRRVDWPASSYVLVLRIVAWLIPEVIHSFNKWLLTAHRIKSKVVWFLYILKFTPLNTVYPKLRILCCLLPHSTGSFLRTKGCILFSFICISPSRVPT